MMKKAENLDADCIALDLEDAVPKGMKNKARKSIKSALDANTFGSHRVFVRINPIDSGMTLTDLHATASPNLRGYIYPMARSASDVNAFSAQLGLMEHELGLEQGHFTIIALIETPGGLQCVDSIAYSSRVEAVLFGCEDYLAEIEGSHLDDFSSLTYARSRIANAAKGAGIVPIDTPFIRVKELDVLVDFSNVGRALGMDGMLVLSPDQIGVANSCYLPNADEIQRARRMIDAAEKSKDGERGVVILDSGEFVSPPTLKWARKIILKYERIQNWNSLK
jgi:citrate lyase subunit beta/citryl-CoA lyase